MTQAVPWNFMELGVRQFRWPEQFHGILWFHGTPWNLDCANFADTSSSMEFHGTWSAPISMTRAVSMEFHGIPWNFGCTNFDDPSVSVEFHELGVRQFRWHEQFHGISWNMKCANFDDTSSSSISSHSPVWSLRTDDLQQDDELAVVFVCKT